MRQWPPRCTRRVAEQALVDVGIDDWTVVVSQPPTEQRPCPSVSFDSSTRRILLDPVPGVAL